jgi:hypothetical protein
MRELMRFVVVGSLHSAIIYSSEESKARECFLRSYPSDVIQSCDGEYLRVDNLFRSWERRGPKA